MLRQKNDLDKLVMLLGTDWFCGHWRTIGLAVKQKEESIVRLGCREIVGQIMSGASEYWLVSFADERVQRTYSMLQKLVKKAGLERAAVDRIKSLVDRSRAASASDGSKWLLTHITQMILNDSAELERVTLAPEIREVLANAWHEFGLAYVDDIDFRELSRD